MRNRKRRAINLGLKLKIAYCKNISSELFKKAVWVGEFLSWTKKRRARRGDYCTVILALVDPVNGSSTEVILYVLSCSLICVNNVISIKK